MNFLIALVIVFAVSAASALGISPVGGRGNNACNKNAVLQHNSVPINSLVAEEFKTVGAISHRERRCRAWGINHNVLSATTGDMNDFNESGVRKCHERNHRASAGAGIAALLRAGFQRYSRLLERSPIPTKIVTSAVIGALGDLLLQILEHLKSSNAAIGHTSFTADFRRLVIFATVCGVYIAPVTHVWFNLLAKLPIPEQCPKAVKALLMMSVDQSLGAVGVISGFFVAFEMVQRLVPPYTAHANTVWQASVLAVNNNLVKTLFANWRIWPVLNFTNFLLVPPQFRVLFANIASVFWNMILSSIANSNGSPVKA